MEISVKIINLIADIFLNLILYGSLCIRLERVDGIPKNQSITDKKDGGNRNKKLIFDRKSAVKIHNFHKILSFVRNFPVSNAIIPVFQRKNNAM